MTRNVYVGKISEKTRERDLEDFFAKYGKITNLSLKYGYGFVEFDDERDAAEAVRSLDGRELDGNRLVVELSRGGGARRDRGDRGDRGDRDRGDRDSYRGGDRFRGRDRDGRDGRDSRDGRGSRDRIRRGPPVRTDNRATIEGLSSTCDWRDIKDLARTIGTPTFADVFKDGTGVVEFEKQEDLKKALKELDGTKFQGNTIHIREDTKRSSSKDRYAPYKRKDRSRSPSPRRSRSPRRDSRSPKRASRSPKRSRSPRKVSPKRGASKSPVRNGSASPRK